MDSNFNREEIEQRMAAIRGNLDGEVGGIVRNARRLVDWRHYVRSFPWSSLAIAAAAGYFVAPRGVRKAAVTIPVAPQPGHAASMPNPPAPAMAAVSGGLFGTVASLATNYAMKMALQYATDRFKSQWSPSRSMSESSRVQP